MMPLSKSKPVFVFSIKVTGLNTVHFNAVVFTQSAWVVGTYLGMYTKYLSIRNGHIRNDPLIWIH